MTMSMFAAEPYDVGDGCCTETNARGAGCPHPREYHQDGTGRCTVYGCQCIAVLPHTDSCIHRQPQGQG